MTLSGAKVLQYSNWSKGEPNNVNGIEHCTGYFVNTKSWNDCICAGQFSIRSTLLCLEQNKMAASRFAQTSLEEREKHKYKNSGRNQWCNEVFYSLAVTKLKIIMIN